MGVRDKKTGTTENKWKWYDILYTGFQQVWINIKSNYPYIRFALYYFGKYLGRPLTRVLKQGSNKCRDHHWCSKIGSPEVGSKPTCLNSVRPFPRWEGKTKNSSHQINLSDYHLFIWQNLSLYIFTVRYYTTCPWDIVILFH